MVSPNIFSINPGTQEGKVYVTDFTYTFLFSSFFEKVTWSLGDGTFVYNQYSVKHSYNFPGIYTVSLSAWNKEGFLTTDFAEVNLDYIYRDALIFSSIPTDSGIAGIKSEQPFVLSLTSCKIDEPISLVLQPFNTNSVPYYAADDKWKYITPRWRFINAETDEIIGDQIQIKTDYLYSDSKIAGVSGQLAFYYIDDAATIQNECPLLLAATLSTQNFIYPTESLNYPYFSYSNSDVVRASIAWQIVDSIPTRLKVTENYINNVYPVKWSSVPIPVLINAYFNSQDLDSFENEATIRQGDVLSYPLTNEFGSYFPVKIALSAADVGIIPENLYTVEVNGTSYSPSNAPLYFTNTDQQGNIASGYVYATVTPLTSFSKSVVVAVSAITVNGDQNATEFSFPIGFPINTNTYISNPIESTLNKLNLSLWDQSSEEEEENSAPRCPSIARYDSLNSLTQGGNSIQNTPILNTFDLSNYTLSGSSGIYNLTYSPVKKRLYAADADQDTILVLNADMVLLSTVQLSSFTNQTNNVPSYISLDRNNNIWVSMFGHPTVLKFNQNFNLLLSVSPTVNVDIETISMGNYLIEPPIVETDMENNPWVCYAHPMSSMLVKFNGQTGQQILQTNELPVSSVPVSLTIDLFNNVWVACYDSNEVLCFNGEDGTLLARVSDIYHPSYLACDRASRVWITHGLNRISVYNIFNSQIESWKWNGSSLISISNDYPQTEIEEVLQENELWAGLTVDVANRVWVIDSVNNKVICFLATDLLNTITTVDILPKPLTNRVVLGGDEHITELNGTMVRSAQAAGDWSGNRWYQKYASGAYSRNKVYGSSAPFKIYDIDKSFQISKVNEGFSTSEYYKSLALSESLKSNDFLFDKFFTALLGNGDITKESMGEIVYEKIANFVKSHGDVETADIKQLLSMSEQLAVDARKYGIDFPREINKLLNIFSINKYFLRGQIDYDADITNNVGAVLSEMSTITAGQYLFAKDRQYNEYQLVYVTPLETGVQVYNLNQLDVEGFRQPLLDNYYFFEYEPSPVGFKNNIIDWNSKYTTLDYSLSTNEQWYGDDGIVETMFNNLITKNLFSN